LPGNSTNAVVNTSRDHRGAERALQAAEQDHRVDVPGQPHSMLVIGEAEREENANSQRVENTLVSQPDIGITRSPRSGTLVWTHDNSSWLADRPPPMSRSEDATIWMSSVAMKKPRHISANANTFAGAASAGGRFEER
jgi:hypothetical protein